MWKAIASIKSLHFEEAFWEEAVVAMSAKTVHQLFSIVALLFFSC